jgi:hypothetical protein
VLRKDPESVIQLPLDEFVSGRFTIKTHLWPVKGYCREEGDRSAICGPVDGTCSSVVAYATTNTVDLSLTDRTPTKGTGQLFGTKSVDQGKEPTGAMQVIEDEY